MVTVMMVQEKQQWCDRRDEVSKHMRSAAIRGTYTVLAHSVRRKRG